jgi:hypothetical protein
MNCTHFVKQPNLKLRTSARKLLGYLPLAFKLPDYGLSSTIPRLMEIPIPKTGIGCFVSKHSLFLVKGRRGYLFIGITAAI